MADDVPGPVRVVLVEAGAEPPELSPDRAAGGRYASALVFAVRDGRLVGEGEPPLEHAVSGAELDKPPGEPLGDRRTEAGPPPPPARPAPVTPPAAATTIHS